MCTQAVYTALSGRCSYMPAITCQLPFCLRSILSLCSFLQQAAVKEAQKYCSSKHWLPQSGKKMQGTKHQSILTVCAPKSCRGNETWNVFFINISSPPKHLNSFLPHWSAHISVKYFELCVRCRGARNGKWKRKKIKRFLNPTFYG